MTFGDTPKAVCRCFFCFLGVSLASCGGGTNDVPVADAGPQQSVRASTTVVLDASGSESPRGTALSYRWKLTGWPVGSRARLSDPTAVNPTLTVDKAGVYVANLTVNDGRASSAPATVVVQAGEISGTQAAGYLPFDTTNKSCTATDQWIYGPETGQQIALATFGHEVVPYTSGARVGIKWGEVLSPTDYNLFDLNGPGVRLLAADDYFASTDCLLTAHPAQMFFGVVSDGMIIDHSGAYWINKYNYADCQPTDSSQTLIKLEDVTVLGVPYQNAMVMWGIDTDFPFTPVSFPNIGIVVTLPTTLDTGGYSVTDFTIVAHGLGNVASGDVNAATGVVLDVRAAVAALCSN